MTFFLVGDGGGTKTDVLLFSEHGQVLGQGHGGGANALFVDAHIAAQNVATAIRAATIEASLSLEQVERIALFIPGFRNGLPLLAAELSRGQIELHGDKENALYTAFGEKLGIAVLSGTGSFVTGCDKWGKECTTGGWGTLFGDEGSAWHIGVLALRHLAALHDETGDNTTGSMLERLVLAALGADDLPDLRRAAYLPEFTRDRVAALAPLVATAAEGGEEDARDILQNAAFALAAQAQTVANRLDGAGLPVALIGGVTRIGADFPSLFAQAIRVTSPMLDCREPLFDPIIGSALYLLADHFSLDGDSLRRLGSELTKTRSA